MDKELRKLSQKVRDKQSRIRSMEGKISKDQIENNEFVFSKNVSGITKMYFKDEDNKLWEFSGTQVQE
jgi:hypothetical protein|tara:strand:+ start:121 stop:324 length:204 start_codon:yes stop_codon:yes gene_type:complete